MAKRFTENNKWEDNWFRRLNPVSKLFWLFVVDKCDIAGFWEIDWELASFYIGAPVNESILGEFEGRLERVNNNGKIWIVKFIEFQYGSLNPAVHMHKAVIKLLDKKGLLERVKGSLTLKEGLTKGSGRVKEGLRNPSGTLKDKDKDKESISIKERGCKGEEDFQIMKKELDFLMFWNIYPKRGNKRVGKQECSDFIKQRIKPEEWEDLLKAVRNYANGDECKNGYARDPIRFLKKDYWRDWVSFVEVGKKPAPVLLKFNEDTEFICGVCGQVKPKAARVYIAGGTAICKGCEAADEKKKGEEFRRKWEGMSAEEKEKHVKQLKRFNVPVPEWMTEQKGAKNDSEAVV